MTWYVLPGILLLITSGVTFYANRGLARINRRDGNVEREVGIAWAASAWTYPTTGIAGLLLILHPIVASWITGPV